MHTLPCFVPTRTLHFLTKRFGKDTDPHSQLFNSPTSRFCYDQSTTHTMTGSSDRCKEERIGRIPKELQAIFLASNQGEEVNEPPPNSVASKVFKPRFSLWKRVSPRRKPKAAPLKAESLPRPPLMVRYVVTGTRLGD